MSNDTAPLEARPAAPPRPPRRSTRVPLWANPRIGLVVLLIVLATVFSAVRLVGRAYARVSLADRTVDRTTEPALRLYGVSTALGHRDLTLWRLLPAKWLAAECDILIVGEVADDHDYPQVSQQIIRMIHAETEASGGVSAA